VLVEDRFSSGNFEVWKKDITLFSNEYFFIFFYKADNKIPKLDAELNNPSNYYYVEGYNLFLKLIKKFISNIYLLSDLLIICEYF